MDTPRPPSAWLCPSLDPLRLRLHVVLWNRLNLVTVCLCPLRPPHTWFPGFRVMDRITTCLTNLFAIAPTDAHASRIFRVSCGEVRRPHTVRRTVAEREGDGRVVVSHRRSSMVSPRHGGLTRGRGPRGSWVMARDTVTGTTAMLWSKG